MRVPGLFAALRTQMDDDPNTDTPYGAAKPHYRECPLGCYGTLYLVHDRDGPGEVIFQVLAVNGGDPVVAFSVTPDDVVVLRPDILII